ncbi:MAG: choice-of-anchor B family protein [Planctomycetes bacterium]|nr:choice-of-anchor B family protein [Planctomycetota bacterium]
MHRPLTTLLTFAFSAALAAQGTNCTLLGNFNNHGPFNDCWGYTAPNGDEYALLGCTTGTVVVDVTNPTSPVERGWLPWSSSTWRDIRTYGHYAYVTTEATAGFEIIDLQNPNAPVSLGAFGTGYSSHAHNICIDTGAGRLYLVGTDTGTPVFDLTASPANPSYLGHAYPAGNSNYFHDLCVENGYGYGSAIYNGQLRIFTAGTLPPTTLSNTATPGNFTHHAWPNAAATVCVTADEVGGGVVKFWDITNKSNPQPLGQFTPNPAATPHNAFIIGDLCHVSWYTEGYRCIDISDPANPVEVAAYDTWPGASGGYNGAWGCYPFLPSGNILVSDRSTGLYIVRPQLSDLAIAHAPLGNTSDEDGPYVVVCDVTGSNPISSITLNWREGNSGGFTAVAMTPTGQPDRYSADIPGHNAITEMQYHIEAVDTVGTVRSPAAGEHRFEIGSFSQLFYDGFETDLGWTHGASTGVDEWQRGTPAGAAGNSGGYSWNDPIGAFAGSRAWGTDLGLPGFDGAYANNTSCWLQSPPIAGTGSPNLRLRFRRWLQLGPNDYALLKVNGVVVAGHANMSDQSWQQVDIDISAHASAPSLVVRFELVSDAAIVACGWNIDEFELLQRSDSAPPRFYGSGTAGTPGLPAIDLSRPACIGTTPDIEGANLLGSGATFLALSFLPANTPVLGISALVAQPAVFHFATASAAGDVAFPFAVPNSPALDNLYIYSQIITVDAGGPQGLAASEGMRFRVCLQ